MIKNMSMFKKMMVKGKVVLFVSFLVVVFFTIFAAGTRAQCANGICTLPGQSFLNNLNSVNNVLGNTGSLGSLGGVTPSDYTLHISNGWESGSSSCGPCNALGKDPGANQAMQNAIGQGMKVDSNGATPTITDKSGKEVARGSDAVKQWAENLKMKDPKGNKDKCVLVTPGMSQKLGTLYGEPKVKANNDKHQFCDKVQANPACTTAVGGKADCVVPPRLFAKPSKAETPTPKYKDIQEIPDELCVWAVDWKGDAAFSSAGSGGDGKESDDNFKVRKIQTQENVDKYMVTMDKDLGLIKPTGANSEIRQGAKYAGQSNEQINKENAAKGGGNVTLVPSDGPSKDQHQEYYFKSSQNERGYTVGSGNKKMYTGAPYTAGEKATSISAKASGKQDVQVTNSCDFQNNTQQSPQPPGSSGNPWPDNGSGGGSGGSNGGGGEGGGGALGKILPALMQALQGLMGGGGQQGNQGYPTPTPYGATPTPYICPSTHVSDSVCGVNGITYASQCVAEYENQMTVKHAGICTTADTTATSSNSVSTITTLLQQLVSSGLPDSLLSSVIDTVTNLITGVLSNNSSVSQTNVQ